MKKRHPIEVIIIAFMIAGLLGQPLPLLANPVGGTVVAGSATINGGPGSMLIQQTSHRAIINWNDFSIGVGEITKFVQPSASSAILNRVVGLNPTKIYGTLEGNGHVYVINQNGILVGRSGVINTRSFVASTLEVNDQSFLSGGALRFSGESSAGIINAGRINALGGDVVFIARTIENSGRISASQGTVGLAAGSEVILQPTGSERIAVIAGKPGGGTGIDNSGAIQAVNAELKAAGGNVYALAINNGGVVRATGFGRDEQGHLVLRAEGGNIKNSGVLAANNRDGSGGSIVVDGGHNDEAPATVINEGEILARGDARGTQGGAVTMTGDYVGLFGRGLIDVSGQAGGGVALVGGGYQGADSGVQNALRTIIAPEATIKAEALSRGNGGKIIVWSEEITRVYGTLLASGAGGRGGFVETSSRGSLDLIGAVVNAGIGGLWLLDPGDITIASSGTAITEGVDFVVPGPADATVDAGSIVSALNNNSSVRLSAAGDISITAAVVKSANPNVTVPTLTLEAGGKIQLAENVSLSSSAGPLNLVLSADHDNSGSGSIILDRGTGPDQPAKLDSNGGTINLHAADLDIDNNEGTIDSNNGSGSGGLITITASNNRNIGLGTGTEFVIGGTELQHISSAGGLRLVTTGAGVIQVQGISAGESANITGTVTLDSASTVSFTGSSSTFNILDVQAANGITANQSVTTDAGSLTVNADADNDGTGTLTVAGGESLNSGGQALNITAADIVLNGSLNSGAGSISMTASGSRSIVLGPTTVASDFELTGAELDNITTSGGLLLSTTGAGTITVDGITAGQSDTVTGVLALNSSSTVTFSGGASTFKAMSAQGTGGITVSADITTTAGLLTLNADSDDNSTGGLSVADGVTVDSGGHALNISAADLNLNTSGKLNSGAGVLTLQASDDRSIGLGAAAGDFQVSGAELQNITVGASGGLVLRTTGSGTITVDGVTGADSANVDGLLTLIAGGAAIFSGGASSFASLTVQSGPGISLGTDVTTTGGQSYDAPVALVGDRVLNGSVTFNSLVDGSADGTESLTINGNATFANFVGSAIRLESVHVTGTTALNAGNSGVATVRTATTQIYDGAVTLGDDTTLAASSVQFNGTVNGTTDGNQSLTITGDAVFGNGAGDFVGNTTRLQFVDVSGSTAFNAGNNSGAANTVRTSGDQTYGGPVTLGDDTTLVGATIRFNDTVDGTGIDSESLIITGNAVFGNSAGDFIGDLVRLDTVSVSGSTIFNAGNAGASTVKTAGTQTYGIGILNDDTTLTGTTVQFNSTVNSATPDVNGLAIGGNGVFAGTVGNSGRLEFLNVSGTAQVNGGLVTALSQNYGSTLTLGQDAVLNGTTLVLGAGGVNGATHDLTLNFSGDTTIDGGLLLNIADLAVGGGGNTILNAGTIQTSGTQTYNDVVRLSGDVILNGTTITFTDRVDGTTDGQEGLSITGNASFAQEVGGIVRLQDLSVSGNTTLNDDVTTLSSQSYGPLTLGQSVTLTGSTISFNGTVNGTTAGGQALAIVGNAVFGNGAGDFVGNTMRLSTLSVSGSSTFNAGNSGADSVRTEGDQTYGGPITLAADTTLRGGTMQFNDKINGTGDGQEALTITGNAVFGNGAGDFVGDVTRLESVNVTGTTIFNAGNAGASTVRTAINQTYGGAVSLGADTTLSGATIQFNSAVNGPAASLSVAGNTVINGGSVTTGTAQNYAGAVTVGADTTFSASALTFGSTVSAGANDITVNANNVSLNGAVTSSGRVSIAPRDAGVDIQIGGPVADGPAALALSQTELNFISADVLQLGRDGLAAEIGVVFDAIFNSANVDTLALVTDGKISGAGLQVSNLRIDADDTVNLSGNNSVTTLAGDFDQGLTFQNTAPLTIGVVDGKTGITAGGDVLLITDTLNIASPISAPGQIVTLQTLSAARRVVLGVDDLNALSLTEVELNRIDAGIIRIGSDTQGAASIEVNGDINLQDDDVLSLRSEGDVTGDGAIGVGSLAIRANGAQMNLPGQNTVLALAISAPNALVPVFNNTVNADTTVPIDGLTGVSGINLTIFNAAAQGQASLSNVEIPLPHRYTVDFGSGGVETVPANLPPGSIWTSYLDVPFPKSDKADRAKRVEDASKFMSGSLAILGSTTGPQTGR